MRNRVGLRRAAPRFEGEIREAKTNEINTRNGLKRGRFRERESVSRRNNSSLGYDEFFFSFDIKIYIFATNWSFRNSYFIDR